MQVATNVLLAKAFEIRSFYNELRIGYDGAADCRSIVGPEPFKISRAEADILLGQGELLRQWFAITIDLCNRSYRDPDLCWLAEVVEGDLPEETVTYHRRAHLSGSVGIPLFSRPDMSSLGLAVEVQVPGSGWGYQTAIHTTVENCSVWPGLIEAFRQALLETTGSGESSCAYVLYNQPFYREVVYFCSRCVAAGINLRMYFQELPKAEEASFVRRPPLQDLLSYPGGTQLVEAFLANRLVLEPNPSLLFDQKIAVAFPFHPRLREYYPDSIRSLFPETHLVQMNQPPVFDGQAISWDSFASLSRSKRQFILKFAGAKKGLRAGGKAVYNLSDCNQQEVQSLIGMALSDWEEHRAPWLIQKRVQEKYPVTFLDHVAGQILIDRPYYALFRPMFMFRPDGSSSIVAFSALFRKEWKVHGSSDAVMLPVEIG